MSFDPSAGFSYIDPDTGQVRMQLEIHNRLAHPRTHVPGCCQICAATLDGNSTGATIAWDGNRPVLGSLPGLGDPVCMDCEIFIGHLDVYTELGAVTDYHFDVGEVVKIRGHEEYFRVVDRHHDGVQELRTWWPVYTCRPLDIQPGLIPRENRNLELLLADHEIEKVPMGFLGDVARASAEPPPAPLLGLEEPRGRVSHSNLEPLRALSEPRGGVSQIQALPDCELPFPTTKAIC